MSIRSQLEKQEELTLSPLAIRSSNSKGRISSEPECNLRLAFQHDRDRILYCKAFRRLKHKTQVFLSPTGDHYRTRLTHTLEVTQIARTVARALRLNEDLTEAISLGHDLGHTPFGHAGEITLNRLLPKGFRHWEQSLRIVDILENNGLGLNLTYEVRMGILNHSKGRGDFLNNKISIKKLSLEAQIVRIADIIAYITHDLDDALRGKLITLNNLPNEITKILGLNLSEQINNMVNDLIKSTLKNDYILCMSQPVLQTIWLLRDFLYNYLYENTIIYSNFIKTSKILEELFQYLIINDNLLKYNSQNQSIINQKYLQVTDYIAGMTDRYALQLYKKIFFPKPWNVL